MNFNDGLFASAECAKGKETWLRISEEGGEVRREEKGNATGFRI